MPEPQVAGRDSEVQQSSGPEGQTLSLLTLAQHLPPPTSALVQSVYLAASSITRGTDPSKFGDNG